MIELRPFGLAQYMERHSQPMSLWHEKLWVETYRRTGNPDAMVGQLVGQFLKMLVLMTGARRVLDIGIFTGSSALAFAEALPKGGWVVTCDTDGESSAMTKQFFAECPQGDKIDVKSGPALQTLKVLTGPFDLCFIDADAANYRDYYEICVALVRSKGLIVLNHTLCRGDVLKPLATESTLIDDLNKAIRNDARVENVLLPLGDGMTLAVKL